MPRAAHALNDSRPTWLSVLTFLAIQDANIVIQWRNFFVNRILVEPSLFFDNLRSERLKQIPPYFYKNTSLRDETCIPIIYSTSRRVHVEANLRSKMQFDVIISHL